MNIGLKWVNKNQHMLKQLTVLKQHAVRASNNKKFKIS